MYASNVLVAQFLNPLVVCFFCQAEDGIRARTVTGVQTCALPISFWRWGLAVPPVVVGLRPASRPARGADPDQRGQLPDHLVDHGVGSLPLARLSVAS